MTVLLITLAVILVLHILLCCSAYILICKDITKEDKRLFWASTLVLFIGPIFIWYLYFYTRINSFIDDSDKKSVE